MIFPIFIPWRTPSEPAPEPMGGKFSHLGVTTMLREEQEMLDTMKHFGASDKQIEFQKGKIAGLQLASNLTEQNKDW